MPDLINILVVLASAVKYILLFITALMALVVFYRAFFSGVTISGIVDKGVSNFLKRKWTIAILSILFFVIYCMTQLFSNTERPDLTVRYSYQEASEGETPNQTRLNVSELLSDEILWETIDRGGFQISVEDLRSCLELKSVYDETEVNIESVSNVNIATEYDLICSPLLEAKGIDTRAFLDVYSDVYYEYFMEHHTENNSILELSFDDISEMDYLDIREYFEVKAQKLLNYISIYNALDSNFRLESNGETFSSLGEKINNFINIDLERYDSYVLGNGISDDPGAYSTRMDYINKLLQVDYDKQMIHYNIRLEAINMYDEQMARIVLVPTTDEQEQFYMSRTKIGADYFAEEADTASRNASNIQEEMSHNEYAKQMVSTSASGAAQQSKADQMISELEEELSGLSEQAIELTNAYLDQKRDGYIDISIDSGSIIRRMDIVSGLIYTVGFGVILSALTLFAYDKKRR